MSFKLTSTDDLHHIPEDEWNALAGTQPFMQHAFMLAMQTSGCAAPATGWHSRHLLLHHNQHLVGIMPLYLKTHSQGEYVFDHAWAHAFERHGLDYYPKLLCAVPFSPVPGPRLLAHTQQHRLILAQQIAQLTQQQGLSSLHVLFPDDVDRQALQEAGYLIREDVQFHWHNQNYTCFEDFLAGLNQKNRKKLRQDSKKVTQAGVRFRWLSGHDIDDATLDFFYHCYTQPYLDRGRRPYLNPDFFQQLRTHMADALFIVQAEQHGVPIASALSLQDDTALYGRYWGSTTFVPGLHFETCYMQAIDYCIQTKRQRFEGGAQGEHKLSRGMTPVRTYSAHWIANERYAHAIADFLTRETTAVDHYLHALDAHSPFKQTP